MIEIKANNPRYNNFGNQQPKSIHIAWYPTIACLKQIVQYCHDVGFATGGHQYTGAQQMHATVLYTHGVLPVDYPKIFAFEPFRKLPPAKCLVKPLAVNQVITHRTPIALIIPSDAGAMIKARSDKLHKKFKLTPNPVHYLYHISISKVQGVGKFKNIQDYYKLPTYNGLLEFDSEVVSYES